MPSAVPNTALEAVARRRFLLGRWPWRSLGYLLTAAVPAFVAVLPLVLLGAPWAVALRLATGEARPPYAVITSLAGLGLLIIVAIGPLVALPLAALERRRLRLVDSRPIASPHRRPPAAGPWPWLRTRYTEAATWRAFGYTVLLSAVTLALWPAVLLLLIVLGGLVASPLLVRDGHPVSLVIGHAGTPAAALPYAVAGLVLLPVTAYVLAVLAGAHGAMARALLSRGTDERLRAELVEVSRSRARLVDAFEAERRRIERDLHDGAQQRLLSLTLQLGLARLDLPPGSPAGQSVADAHEQAKQLMVELRELVRGIHPRVLTDRGLPAAIDELADRFHLPVTVDADLPARPARHIEGTAYFVVTEALTNIAKHSGATAAGVTVRHDGDLLTVEIRDDGDGGADPRRGTGLTGLADRVAVTDGRMLLSSPAGGPTVLRVELPCSLSEPRSE
ncbi:sensor histidine kinase [Actinoallomurus iriomotensis]|uniref:sensor histidine kinase n=1 Tax=Actinoallomurus iriomotensis TaxID=478107 RepID=UPI00255725D9|nr:sensor histidine kinase [Actinoallomurus iriomotensis]